MHSCLLEVSSLAPFGVLVDVTGRSVPRPSHDTTARVDAMSHVKARLPLYLSTCADASSREAVRELVREYRHAGDSRFSAYTSEARALWHIVYHLREGASLLRGASTPVRVAGFQFKFTVRELILDYAHAHRSPHTVLTCDQHAPLTFFLALSCSVPLH